MTNQKNGSVRIIGSKSDTRIPLMRRLLPSFTSLTLVIYFIISLLLNGDVQPLTRRGFFCGDSSISYPFKVDTIGIKTLMFVALIVPGTVIKLCDNALTRLLNDLPIQARLKLGGSYGKRRKDSDDVDPDEINIEAEELISVPEKTKRRNLIINESSSDYEVVRSGDNNQLEGSEGSGSEADVELFTRIPLDSDQEQNNAGSQKLNLAVVANILQRTFGEFQLFFFGFSSTMLFTGIGKITCGRFRPHFIQRCLPDVDCSATHNANRYIEDFKCTNVNLRSRDMSYISTSWPSGHASIMFYSMSYLIIYLNTVIPVLVLLSSQKKKRRFDPLILYVVYVLMIALACYISLTRVSDYHHHPLDVFSGSVIGSVVAITFAKSLTRLHSNDFA